MVACLVALLIARIGFHSFVLTQREEEQQEENAGLVKSTGENEDGKRRAMITPALREALTKQGENV